ncbi:DUF2071 domain-containing protein [Pontibacter beigongshangensis]|uniref:DUF2071 domain-containing protein n=1 Tax=Pontibacter beigongshangensis TaxID=2574733 RepID=UPI0016508253|nr:DUF2071 domain-containing protein [Pontibacter beigongshangensis]
MEMLKKLPLTYVGELHDVRLINFSVEQEEVLPLLPERLRLRDFQGRSLISMVNVKLRHMRPDFMPDALHFNYQHIGFRLLIDDRKYNGANRNGDAKGIYFLRSFTDKSLMVHGGSIFTNYRLEKAAITNSDNSFELRQGNEFLKYNLRDEQPPQVKEELKQMVGALDRAYSYIGDTLMRVQIMREGWPIEWATCEGFETNFFSTAKFEGAFRVRDMVPYQWLPPKPVPQCVLSY